MIFKYKVYSVKFTPDGKRLISSGRDDTVKVWDVEKGTLLKVLKLHSNTVTKFFNRRFMQLQSVMMDSIWHLEVLIKQLKFGI